MTTQSAAVEHFGRLLGVVCPGSRLSLYTLGGSRLWLQDNADDTPESLDLAQWQRSEDGVLQAPDKARLAWPVCDEQQQVSQYLVVSAAGAISEQLSLGAAPVLELAARVLSGERYLNRQLDSMARELAARYEELNLVYYTDDEVRFLDEGRQALHSLVQNCNDYLAVEYASILMPEQGIRIACSQSNSNELLDVETQNKLVQILRIKGHTIVVNEPEETEDLLGCNYKLIASPIHDGNGQVAGALVILRLSGAKDFENSDRNLLIVMAGKASKIIQSSYDSLTGLMKQENFERSLRAAASRVAHSDIQHAVLHINIDRLHLVNDTQGFHAGDRVIQAVATLLRSKLRETDHIARLGGDEFGILLHSCGPQQAGLVADKLCRAVAELNVEHEDTSLEVTMCIGIASLEADADSIIDAQAGAEIACKVAKERGRNRWQLFDRQDPALQARRQHMQWLGAVKQALEEDRFELHSQRIVPIDSANGKSHFEVLVRMRDEHGELVSPGLFLPVAERYQLMPQVDRWVVSQTLQALAPHHQAMTTAGVGCSVNLSGQTMVDADFAPFVCELFKDTGVPPSLICFEVTETAAIANLEVAQNFMHALKRLGCRFALDDFGAGLSSFAYLRSLPVDYLKLDGSFVKPIVEDQTSASMLAAMHQIGKICGLQTVAEYVENDTILEHLRQMGVDFAQGYGIARPRPLTEELAELSTEAVPA
ncbi:MAG: EAL domain-containing protein [Gammaproteobacteria bacterium]|nr:EAL domain-containing protein [Gammaproteobacteria bacterium]